MKDMIQKTSKEMFCEEYLAELEKRICASLGVPKSLIGVDYGYSPDAMVHLGVNQNGDVFQIEDKTRSKAMQHTFGSCYGEKIIPWQPKVVPFTEADVQRCKELLTMMKERFPELDTTPGSAAYELASAAAKKMEPLPPIEYGAPLSSKPLNAMIDHINTMQEEIEELKKRKDYGEPVIRRFLQDMVLYGTVTGRFPSEPPPPQQLPPPEPKKDNPYIDLADAFKLGHISAQSFAKEYLGNWHPPEEPNPPRMTAAEQRRRDRVWERYMDDINCKEKNMPMSEAIGKEEVQARQAAKARIERQKHERCYSEGTKAYLLAQEALKVKKSIQKEVVKHELTQEEAKLEQVKQAVHWQPRHCKKCGHSMGCMCPREPEPAGDTLCKHVRLVQIPLSIAKELEPNITHDIGVLHYACLDCHELVLKVPMGSIKSVRK